MNAVEIEQAVTDLAEQPFDADEFPFAFLEAFGNKPTTLKKLRSGASNKSDLGGVLQTNNIHVKTCAPGTVAETLTVLRASPATARGKAKYILATDGQTLEAEDLTSGDTIACAYKEFPNHFGFFLTLAGISTVRAIKENAFDIRATSRLNRLYVELLKDNPDWGTAERRPDMNHFMARLIFCFFAEDTDIFNGTGLFTATIDQMSDRTNTHEVIGEIFRAMNVKPTDRAGASLPRWADVFPYVNGGLFSGSVEVPGFSRIARSYLLHIGNLDWTQINPDIFGSMIQAVADDEERGALGMHYTSVPNILKVLNPLFLDDLNAALDAAGDNARKLLNLRGRIARIRVFDPACGSGNFLVIAYKQLRAIEAEINRRRGESDRKTEIPLTNFRGIEIRDFSAEIARLALIIAEYQCDVTYRGQKEALAAFLPLDAQNWITCGNALRLDWLSVCPPTGTGVKLQSDDLFQTPLDQAQIDFENEGGETYICGNPPYLGSTWQSKEQKDDLKRIFDGRTKSWKSLDYVAGWFMKAADYGLHTPTVSAFVSTNSICQGSQVPILWPLIFATGHEIVFAHTSFRWANLASYNAGVTVAIVAISNHAGVERKLFALNDSGETVVQDAANINAYLVAAPDIIIAPKSKANDGRALMEWGNKPTDGGNFFMNADERQALLAHSPQAAKFVKRFLGAQEFIRGQERYCLWIEDVERGEAEAIPEISRRVAAVAEMRASSKAAETRPAAEFPHRFRQIQSVAEESTLVVARVSSEGREFLPIGLEGKDTIIGDRNFALYDAPLWNMALIASRLHWVWIGTVCVRLEMRFSYSNTLGWNTFPVPKLTEKNRADLTAAAENILLAREAHFPATIADLYDPENMPDNLRAAHDHNDEVLERIYIGRRFKNDTERLEKLFEMYTKMTTKVGANG
ncbi:class I SAM-dependent DNA methyltransferase [Paracoccus aurantiacus]|uniref:site-specific DNA-methyltransferase (adenine-specific) n=1 Tax=Paracoccus aurantiacus TaxID=2599412 RepID=A0A5C6RN18_9RHOB|nr:DNA methyltransferase [Paracoccus aurantiacus]TXB63623.1 class I SAM-dependent DNA methyltransferase [Paracoccus aurantiacus]